MICTVSDSLSHEGDLLILMSATTIALALLFSVRVKITVAGEQFFALHVTAFVRCF